MTNFKGVDEKIKNKNDILRKNLKKAIDESGMKKTWIAKEMGISYSSLWRQLNGSRKLKAEIVAQIIVLTRKKANDIFEF